MNNSGHFSPNHQLVLKSSCFFPADSERFRWLQVANWLATTLVTSDAFVQTVLQKAREVDRGGCAPQTREELCQQIGRGSKLKAKELEVFVFGSICQGRHLGTFY